MKTIKLILFPLLASILLVGCFNKEVQKDNPPMNDKTEIKKEENQTNTKKDEQLTKEVKIINLKSNTRPYAVMINNHHEAWPQSGLQSAYLVYEIPVEGGITRMMALFRDVDVEKIGSVRSSRVYYLDYAMENDAIYVHFGGSNEAYMDLANYKINNIDGNKTGSSAFWRDKTLNRALEHTAFTSTSNIKKMAETKKYRLTSSDYKLLNYTPTSIDLSKIDGFKTANKIDIKYSSYQTSSYQYDAEKKYYLRSMNNTKNIDLVTGQQYTVKNIIVYSLQFDTASSKLKTIHNIGTGTGYYISEGIAIPITWEKKTRFEKTVYKYMNGTILDINDGNTYIQLYPNDGVLTIQ